MREVVELFHGAFHLNQTRRRYMAYDTAASHGRRERVEKQSCRERVAGIPVVNADAGSNFCCKLLNERQRRGEVLQRGRALGLVALRLDLTAACGENLRQTPDTTVERLGRRRRRRRRSKDLLV